MKKSVKFGEGFGKDWRKQLGEVYDVGHQRKDQPQINADLRRSELE